MFASINFRGNKKESLVFAFQANIYCCLLSLILRFDLVTRSNSSPTGPKEIHKNGKLGMLFPPQNERVLAKKIIAFNNNQKKIP